VPLSAHYPLPSGWGPPESGSPRWFLGSKNLVLNSNKEGRFEIYGVDLNNSAQRRRTSYPGDNVAPMASWDDKTICFSTRRTGSWQDPRISSEGGDPVQFTRNGRFSPHEAPAGNCLYYQKGDVQVSELWRVPMGGGERRQVLASVGDRRFAVQSDGIYFFAWARYRSMA